MERSVSPASDSDVPFKVSDTLAPPRVNKIAGTTTINFDGLLNDPLLLKEDLKNGCGGQLWPAGMVLSRYLLSQHTSDMSGKTMSVVQYARDTYTVPAIFTFLSNSSIITGSI